MTGEQPALELLSGWGRAAPTRAEVYRVRTQGEVERLVEKLAGPGQRLVARGLGRAYGDAAQCAGGAVIDMTGLSGCALDAERGVVVCGAGLSLAGLLDQCLQVGWFVPVTPGTRHVTLGGALAADVHGKNHHRDGSLGRHVRALRLVTPAGPLDLSPTRDPEAFWATVGGMGLTGVVTALEVQLTEVETAYMRVDTDRARDLDEAMALLSEGDSGYRYSVAWIDCLARGAALGRSVLTRAEHATLGELGAAEAAAPLSEAPRRERRIPPAPARGVVGAASVRAFNLAYFARAPRHEEGAIQPLGKFFYPLDVLSGWNALYGSRGFTQYQLVVPFGAEDTLRKAIESLQAARLPVSLAVLKRFGEQSPAPLSFAQPGWTLALDVALGRPGLPEALDALDALVVSSGGRVYLAKDGRVSPALVPEMYPRLDAWREVAARLDPTGSMASDLARRLHLREGPQKKETR